MAALPFGILPATTWVDVTDDELRVRFGPWSLRTPLSKVSESEPTGDFAFVKTAGPPHLSCTDRGVTFATNGELAVCVRFQDPVKVLDPFGLIRHLAATLTVADPAALARDLEAA